MLDIAKLRLNKKDSSSVAAITFIEGDAEKLPFGDNQFDGAIISFGLRNLSHLNKGLSEMTRVVKPGSKIVES